ncbi:lactate utilization protein [Alloiococcus sp. CFN-8]|uniref:lactate utilization protein n=1 Tax=Alloiococcus sp. CFN-8 TaxID=3416081 RepID=UPI003CF5BA07
MKNYISLKLKRGHAEMDVDIKVLKENFRLRNIEVEAFDSLNEIKAYILNIIPSNSTIGIGHSLTLQKMNITHLLSERGNIVYDKELSKSREERQAVKKKALIADWYITGSNSISIDGRIVNIDHSGNRVAAITFGPDKVIIVVGKNKIVNTLEEAIKRVKNVACPLNARRTGLNPPCATLNRCVDCVSMDRVCNTLSIIEGQSETGRIKLLIANEDAGY